MLFDFEYFLDIFYGDAYNLLVFKRQHEDQYNEPKAKKILLLSQAQVEPLRAGLATCCRIVMHFFYKWKTDIYIDKNEIVYIETGLVEAWVWASRILNVEKAQLVHVF